jgi:hypothetical protein
MTPEPDWNQLTGNCVALGVALVGLRALWPFFTKTITDNIEGLRTELKTCHEQHSQTKSELDEMKGKISVLEAYNPRQMVGDIIEGIKDHLNAK